MAPETDSEAQSIDFNKELKYWMEKSRSKQVMVGNQFLFDRIDALTAFRNGAVDILEPHPNGHWRGFRLLEAHRDKQTLERVRGYTRQRYPLLMNSTNG